MDLKNSASLKEIILKFFKVYAVHLSHRCYPSYFQIFGADDVVCTRIYVRV